MIYTWKLSNFKSIRRMDTIELGDLTIIAGPNSSGKSTITQSILLMMQTLANREDVPLQFNGDLVRLGECRDVWHKGEFSTSQEAKRLGLEMTLKDFYNEGNGLYIGVEFDPVGDMEVDMAKGVYAIGAGRDYRQYSHRLDARWDGNAQKHVVGYVSRALFDEIATELRGKGLNAIEPLENNQLQIEDFYPRSVLIGGRVAPQHLNWETALIDPLQSDFTDFLDTPLDIGQWEILLKIARDLNLPGLETNPVIGKRKRLVSTFGEYKTWFGNLPALTTSKLKERLTEELPGVTVGVDRYYTNRFMEDIEFQITEIFTRRIKYLSANRFGPTALFSPDANSNWTEVGITGANVAAAIRDHARKYITFWDPYDNALHEVPFANALATWLQYFELVDRVDIVDQGKIGTMLKVFASGMDKELDLTSVGFGTSQILPIVVQGLLTLPNTTFIVEQPEVHLHPRVQSQLGDFFLALTRAGVQCIVETHSEHIVNRIRLRIVQDTTDYTLNCVRMFFVEKAGTESVFHRVEPNIFGAIPEWPAGFFDQAETEAALIAEAARKRVQAEVARKK